MADAVALLLRAESACLFVFRLDGVRSPRPERLGLSPGL